MTTIFVNLVHQIVKNELMEIIDNNEWTERLNCNKMEY